MAVDVLVRAVLITIDIIISVFWSERVHEQSPPEISIRENAFTRHIIVPVHNSHMESLAIGVLDLEGQLGHSAWWDFPVDKEGTVPITLIPDLSPLLIELLRVHSPARVEAPWDHVHFEPWSCVLSHSLVDLIIITEIHEINLDKGLS